MDRGARQTFFQIRPTDGKQTHEKMFTPNNYQGNTNQNHNEIALTAIRMAKTTKTRNSKC